jgi:hypothetical protein
MIILDLMRLYRMGVRRRPKVEYVPIAPSPADNLKTQ